MKFAAAAAGHLPPAGAAIVGGVRLPAGRLITPGPDFARGPVAAPVLWLAEPEAKGFVSRLLGRAPSSDYGALARAFDRTGLWPLMCASLGGGEEDRPWSSGELDPPGSSRPDAHDAARVLADFWANAMPPPDEIDEQFRQALEPFGAGFPGLAPAAEGPDDDGSVERAARASKGRLGLVAVTRPADVVPAIGWSGPVNHSADMGLLAAVLRSWEDRFGAIVVGIGFDTLTLAVQRPVGDGAAAERLAAEHLAACPDNIFQGAGGLREYAQSLVGASTWEFWWD